MQELGDTFVQTFLVPYIQDDILGNVDKDERLQRVIRFDTTPEPTDIEGLEITYFTDTGTVLDTDMPLRKVFFKEFVDFINRQKLIVSGDARLLAFRLLPDPETGAYSKEAQNNIEKFGFQAVKALEEHVAEQIIKQKEASGEIKGEKAEDDRKKLKDGKLILVKKKDENYDYKSEDQIKRAIASQENAREFWEDVLSDDTPDGRIGYGFNPVEYKGATLNGLQKQAWMNMAVKVEKELENNGIFVEARLKVDQNGVVYGNVQDKNRAQLKVEISVIKPGVKNYKFTFVKQPAKHFYVNQDNLGEWKKKSANEVYTEKQLAEKRKSDLILKKGIPIKGKAPKVTMPPKLKSGAALAGEVGGSAGGGTDYYTIAGIPGKASKQAEIEERGAAGPGIGAQQYAGPMEAKDQFKQQLTQEVKGTAKGGRQNYKKGRTGWRNMRAKSNRFGKSPAARVAKIYGAVLGGGSAAAGIFSFLT